MAGYGRGANEFALVPPHLEEAMGAILSFAPVGANQQLVQNRALVALEEAVEFRRNRVGVSRAEIAPVQWTVITFSRA